MAHISRKDAKLLAEFSENSNTLWAIKQSNLGGRGMFAIETIKKGNLIFTNKPLVVAPRGDSFDVRYCSICYKMSDLCYFCQKCSSIVCCEDCLNSSEHETECKFIINNWKPKFDYDKLSDVLKQVQVYLRFLLLTQQQKTLLTVLQKCDIKSNIKELEDLCSKYVVSEDQIQYIKFSHSIMKVNSFRIAEKFQDNKISLRGLYPISAFLNHSCAPNTRNIFKDDYSMEVYASKNIEKGEEILTCYTGLLWCTPARRYQLYVAKNFWCNCERCEDRTEMGTNLSALMCLKKQCVGVLLPKKPLSLKVAWFCDNCNSEIPASKISAIQSVLGSLVNSLDLDAQFRLDAPILGRLASLIPYTNHIFIDIRLRLAMKLGFAESLKLNGI